MILFFCCVCIVMLSQTKAFSTVLLKSYCSKARFNANKSIVRCSTTIHSRKSGEEHLYNSDMRVRFKEVKNSPDWQVTTFTKEESDEINRLLNIKESAVQQPQKPKVPKLQIDPLSLDDSERLRIRGFLELNPSICSGCGADFQTHSEDKPGFLNKEKFKEHQAKSVLIRKKQEALKILNTAGVEPHTETAMHILTEAKIDPEVVDGIRLLVEKQIKINKERKDRAAGIVPVRPPPPTPEESELQAAEGINSIQQLKKLERAKNTDTVCICQRCFRLQQYGKVENSLRPGWSDNELLTPQRFEQLLSKIKDHKAVVLCLVDLFDLHGSLLTNLKTIAGANPIVIAANKIDLLPKDLSEIRVKNWLNQEIKYVCNLISPVEAKAEDRRVRTGMYIRDYHDHEISEEGVLRMKNIHLVSCTTGAGMDDLMKNIYSLAEKYDKKVYVMGAANVGKSSFINRMLETKYRASHGKKRKGDAPRPLDENPQATVSNLPGTTLNFLKIKLPNDIVLIDTPGLLNEGQLTSKLTTDELGLVIPRHKIRPVTLRLEEGGCVMLGGLATVELVAGRSFFFTFFVSNEVKLHKTSATRVESFLESHIGKLIGPPSTIERVRELGEQVSEEFEIQGDTWKVSQYDIVIAGLGWVAITGPGLARIKVTVPTGTKLGVRPSLLPFEVQTTKASYTGNSFRQKGGRFIR